MLKLRVVRNENFEEEAILENVETKEVLMHGDCYHDKIDEAIEGFLEGLSFCGQEYELLDTIAAKRDEFYG